MPRAKKDNESLNIRIDLSIYEFGDPKSTIVLIQPVDDHDLSVIENEVRFIRERTELSFHLIAVKIDNWNHDLSPWNSPAVFADEDFGDVGKRDCPSFPFLIL